MSKLFDHKIMIIFSSKFKIMFWVSQLDYSFEYLKHMFELREKKFHFYFRSLMCRPI